LEVDEGSFEAEDTKFILAVGQEDVAIEECGLF